MITFNVAVILPAAGSGVRAGGPDATTPKQYLPIVGRPLFHYALDAFCELYWVKKIVLVVDSPETVEGLIESSDAIEGKLIVVNGDVTRHRSIRAGLIALQMDEASHSISVVVIHDAVRPLLPDKEWLESLVLEAEKCGAAGSIVPLVSTVLEQGPDGLMCNSLDRNKYVSSETPQAFQYQVLATAYSKCTEKDLTEGTECLQLVLEYTGIKAKLINGTSDLWKVTYKKDVSAAIACLKEKTSHVCIISSVMNDAVLMLTETLKPKVARVECLLADLTEPNDFSNYRMFNTIVAFCEFGIEPNDLQLGDANLLDRRLGLIIIIKESSLMPGSSRHRTYIHHSDYMERWKSKQKGVVMINRKVRSDNKRLADLILGLIFSDAFTFSGQTFFL